MSSQVSSFKAKFSRLTERRVDVRSVTAMRKIAAETIYTGFATFPNARDFGDFNAAKSALKGQIVLLGQRFDLHDAMPWDLKLPAQVFSNHLHGFEWLAEFEALGSKAARKKALSWLLDWIERYGDGSGNFWAADLVGQRTIQLISHFPFVNENLDEETKTTLTSTICQHLAYGIEVLPETTALVPRLSATLNLLQAATCLRGFERQRETLQLELERECATHLVKTGTLRSRNPQQLLELFQALVWTGNTLDEAGHPRGTEHKAAINAIAPVLRGLRHGDGTLARFHGGASGIEGPLDRALADSRIRTRPREEAAMGYVRLHSGRLVTIMDCARPPGNENAITAHASTLAFEMSSGRRKIVVNCGPGAHFGADWIRSPRTTAAHSTLALDKTSFAKLAAKSIDDNPNHIPLITRPNMVTVSQSSDATGMWLQARHDGYLEDYGLLHERRLFVGASGAEVHGEDALFAPESKAERRFAQRIRGAEKLGVGLSLHFHLHPDVKATLARETDIVTLEIGSGEIWIFEQNGGQVDLETSAFLSPDLAAPLPARQIVVRMRATSHKADLSWSFMRTGKNGPSLRDLPIDAR